jgi:hypothetical protein
VRTLLPFLLAIAVHAADLSGTVRDAQGGEPLSHVRLMLECPPAATFALLTDAHGHFTGPSVPAGCTLSASTVGYRPVRIELHDATEVDLTLTPDHFVHAESIEVNAGPFDPVAESSPSERTLTGAEMKNLAGVIIDDPLRAVQSLPGVASNDEFDAQFSLRGASFDNIGIVVDGTLLHNPFHTVEANSATGSLTIFSGESVEEMTLHSSAPPPEFSDRTDGVLDVHLREGETDNVRFRVNVGVASSDADAEGPFDHGRGSWFVAVRKSYMQYLIDRAESSGAGDALAFDFFDTQAKLAWTPVAHQHFTLTVLDGTSDLNREAERNTTGINGILTADSRMTFVSAGWRYTPDSDFTLQTRGAWLRERWQDDDPQSYALGGDGYGEWSVASDASWQWHEGATLAAGYSLRRERDDGYERTFQSIDPLLVQTNDTWRGVGLRYGAYAEQAYHALHSHLTVTLGGRWDRFQLVQGSALSPHVSLGYRLGKTLFLAAWSQAAQYPEIMLLTETNIGNRALPPMRANHTAFTVDHSLNDRTRVRVEVYQRNDRDLDAQSFLLPRLAPNGSIIAPSADPEWLQSERMRARGAEIFLQRRSANRVSGWVSYAYNVANVDDRALGLIFPADYDQRHAVNAFASVRIKPTVNLSARYTYGTNFPIPGFVQPAPGGGYELAAISNGTRLPAYQRADFRVNRSFQWNHWRGTLYAEVANFLNDKNKRFDSLGGYNGSTGAATVRFDSLFPILPAAGVMFEWDAAAYAKHR